MPDLALPRSILLDRDEEHDLAVAWRERGDAKARERLILSQLRLAEKIAREWWRVPLSLDDLAQEARAGILVAVDRFDPERGTRLSTYATQWMRAFVVQHVFAHLGQVRFGGKRAQRAVLFGYASACREVFSRGERVTDAAVAQVLGVPEADVRETIAWAAGWGVALDAEVPGHDNGVGRKRGDFFATLETAGEEDAAGESIDADAVAQALDDLKPREALVVRARYLTEPPETLAEMGKKLGLSRERVRQIEVEALEKLRKKFTRGEKR